MTKGYTSGSAHLNTDTASYLPKYDIVYDLFGAQHTHSRMQRRNEVNIILNA